jgi:hypothetical protein
MPHHPRAQPIKQSCEPIEGSHQIGRDATRNMRRSAVVVWHQVFWLMCYDESHIATQIDRLNAAAQAGR